MQLIPAKPELTYIHYTQTFHNNLTKPNKPNPTQIGVIIKDLNLIQANPDVPKLIKANWTQVKLSQHNPIQPIQTKPFTTQFTWKQKPALPKPSPANELRLGLD